MIPVQSICYRTGSSCAFCDSLFVVGTNYPEVNNLISRYINKYRTFPDYQDVRDIIVRCNDRHSLKIKLVALFLCWVYGAGINFVVVFPGPKKVAKNRHLCTIAQLCQTISS